jgi:hypothetical protein
MSLVHMRLKRPAGQDAESVAAARLGVGDQTVLLVGRVGVALELGPDSSPFTVAGPDGASRLELIERTA